MSGYALQLSPVTTTLWPVQNTRRLIKYSKYLKKLRGEAECPTDFYVYAGICKLKLTNSYCEKIFLFYSFGKCWSYVINLYISDVRF